MKMLFQNWRKYLTEDESQYFPWLKDLRDDPRKWLSQHGDSRTGTGAFRATFIPDGDPDFVVKFVRRMSSAFTNKIEKILGDEYPDVFPRVYASADDFEWIVADRVVPLHRSNQNLLEEAMIATFPELYEYVSNLERAFGYNPMDIFGLIMNSTWSRKNEIRKFAVKNSDWYNQLLKAVHRYGVDVDDIDAGNIGLDMKTHTLKVLDGSVFSGVAGERDWNK